jgi:pilus assembly protein Flp/PilA
MMTLLRSFLADESAATAIEYGLIAAGIALAIVTVVNNTGTALLNNKFNSISVLARARRGEPARPGPPGPTHAPAMIWVKQG